MIRTLSVLALLGLVACGVDGKPSSPTVGELDDLKIADDIDVDVDFGSRGVYSEGTIGVSQGSISVGVEAI